MDRVDGAGRSPCGAPSQERLKAAQTGCETSPSASASISAVPSGSPTGHIPLRPRMRTPSLPRILDTRKSARPAESRRSIPDRANCKRIPDRISAGLASLAALVALPASASARVDFVRTDYAVGQYPTSVAVGDFNADSDPDLAVANVGSDDVSVLLGGVGGSFGAADQLRRRQQPRLGRGRRLQRRLRPRPRGRQLALRRRLGAARRRRRQLRRADRLRRRRRSPLGRGRRLQRRLRPRPRGRQLRLRRRLGAARRRRRQLRRRRPTFAAGDVPVSVAVGDFNGDSDPDLAVANVDSDNVSVLLGGAGGSFGAPDRLRRRRRAPARSRSATSTATPIPTSRSPTTAPTTSRCCSAAPAAASARQTNFAAGDAPHSVAVGDFNADSDPDLAVANSAPTTSRCCSAAPAASFGAPDQLRRRRRAPLGRGRRLQRRLATPTSRSPTASSARPPFRCWSRAPGRPVHDHRHARDQTS